MDNMDNPINRKDNPINRKDDSINRKDDSINRKDNPINRKDDSINRKDDGEVKTSPHSHSSPTKLIGSPRLDSPPSEFPALSPEVIAAIGELFPSSDPLDQVAFDPIEYINNRFPTQQSMSQLDDVMSIMKKRIDSLDIEISNVLKSQSSVEDEGKEVLDEVTQVINQLTIKIKDMKEQAQKSQLMVNEITYDIKSLDHAKRNLTSSIVLLNNLHILVEGVERMKGWMASYGSNQRLLNYGQLAPTLESCLEVLNQLQHHVDLPQIRELAVTVDDIRSKLGSQIMKDFNTIYIDGKLPLDSVHVHPGGQQVPRQPNVHPGGQQVPRQPNVHSGGQQVPRQPLRILSDACLVVDSLDPSIRNQLIEGIISHEVEEYKTLFQANQDISWLDKVDKRFSWFKKHLVQFEERYGLIFPLKWEVSERIAVHFCHITNQQLTQVMDARKRYDQIRLDDLLFAFSKSSAFEHLLSQKFPGMTLLESESQTMQGKTVGSESQTMQGKTVLESGNQTMRGKTVLESGTRTTRGKSERKDVRMNPFQGLITECFEPHLTIFVSAQDKNISQLIHSFADDMGSKGGCHGEAVAEVFPSSGILFTQYKNCLIQCVNLSTGTLLRDLSVKCFKENLILYANRVLLGSLPELPSNSSTSSSWSSVVVMAKSPSTVTGGSATATIASTTSNIANKATNALQSFLKAEEGNTFTNVQIIRICCIILTANYCLETTQQLEKKLKEKIDENLKTQIDMSREIDSFNSVINTCLDLLVGNVDSLIGPSLNTMKTTNWSLVETPTKPSCFVSEMIRRLQTNFHLVRDNLTEARKYFASLCIKFAEQFIPKYKGTLVQCKSLSQGAAEQLLLDTQLIKKSLIELPTFGSLIKSPPSNYTKIILEGLTKAEMILKVVLVPHSPSVDTFIDNYYQLIPDPDISDFMRILEMKGIKKGKSNERNEFNVILDKFRLKSIERTKNEKGD